MKHLIGLQPLPASQFRNTHQTPPQMVTVEHFIVTVLPGFQPQGEVRYLTCVGGFCLVCSDRIPLQPHHHPIHLKISGMSFEVYSLRYTIRQEIRTEAHFKVMLYGILKPGVFFLAFSSVLFLFISSCHCVYVVPPIVLQQKTANDTCLQFPSVASFIISPYFSYSLT